MNPRREQPPARPGGDPPWLRTLGIIALVNFFSFISVLMANGGALRIKEAPDGRYYNTVGGERTEVSEAFYHYAWIHGASVLVTHGALIASGIWWSSQSRRKPDRENDAEDAANSRATIFVKKRAHAWTVLCVCWLLFSGLVTVPFHEWRAGLGLGGLLIAVGVWGLHLLFIGVAAWHWLNEKPRTVDVGRNNHGYG